ncbi:hypothetical protein SFRURICE_008499 [Spodoptera frugiperda]|nr:hypothetical protein SFRURICE_008499 [Spodoptera frugiperda]
MRSKVKYSMTARLARWLGKRLLPGLIPPRSSSLSDRQIVVLGLDVMYVNLYICKRIRDTGENPRVRQGVFK